jgi:isoquinoline 1-oxidoreductase subunit beta
MITRRFFLGTAGALVVSASVPVTASASAAAANGGVLAPTVFVRVNRDGRVVATVPKPDTGQGVRTLSAVLVAEELAVDVSDVSLEQAPGDTATYGSQIVANSSSTRQLAEPLRTASATARCLLVAAAAARWGVPVEECVARDGHVEHPRREPLPYRALVRDAAELDPATVPVTLTPPQQWRLIGRTRAGRADARDIVSGRARYGIDSAPSGSLVAVVARPPWIGAVIEKVDDADARSVPGVVSVVRLDAPDAGQGGVAVVAESMHEALRGRDALRVSWRAGTPTADSREWLSALEAALPAAPPGADLQRVCRLPLLAHAPMEPMNATAHVTATSAEVWAPIQDPGGLRSQLAGQLGMPEGQVRVNATLAGGAFGRRIEPDAVLEALACSRATGRPVTVRWTREDDTRHDSYRPMSVHRLSARLGADGVPTSRTHQVATWPLTVLPVFENPAFVRLSGDHFPYAVPGEISIVLRPAPLRTGFWRAVYAGQFGYAEETFLSEIAKRGGHDQVDLRRRLLPEGSRLRRVLDAAAERAGWSGGVPAPLTRGVACHLDYGSAIAVIATADPTARRIVRVTAAVDVGVAVHPSGVTAQVEGGVLDAVSTVLGAQITVREGAVAQTSFRDYAWARIDDCPDIDVVIVPSQAPIGGLGELAYPPAAAAIASALAHGGDPVTGMPYGIPVG